MIDRIAPTRRPLGAPAGYQKWRSLLFLHWDADVASLRALVPPELTIDTYDGKAYVGLVAFTMTGVRPTRFLPAIPGTSDFHETNLRTYVHHNGRDPGVWFFSLDAANSLAVRFARRFWGLPYFRASMQVEREGDAVAYRSTREWPEPSGARVDIAARIGESAGESAPGSLQHFMAERYLLYAKKGNGPLRRGQVHHTPYPLRHASPTRLEESLCDAARVRREGTPCSALFSDGVDVEVFALEDV